MATISDFDDRERDDSGNDTKVVDTSTDRPDRDPDLDLAASAAGDSVADNASVVTNPRKRKKSSRASVFVLCVSVHLTLCLSRDS